MPSGTILRRGRFVLATGYARGEWLRNGGLALAMLLIGLGMAVYGAVVTSGLLETARIWRDGQPSTSEVGYGGEVVVHYLLLKRYDLDVTFLPDGTEQPRTFEAAFVRFFTGPDEGDEMTVKYDPRAPEHAVCSWQYEALTHGAVWSILIWGIALCGFLVTFVVTRDLVRTLGKVAGIAQEGQLMRARVVEAKRTGTHSTPLLVLRYQTPRGEVVKQTFFAKRGEPYFVAGGEEVLVLSTIDERSSYALRDDGYPLAERPEVDEET